MVRFSGLPKPTRPPHATKSAGVVIPDKASERVEQHFDMDTSAYADAYFQRDPPAGFFHRRRQAIVMRLLQPAEGKLVLDVGCGPGLYAEPLVDKGYQYLGIDLSHEMIREADKRFGRLEGAAFSVGDAQQLSIASGSVDAVLCLGMLEYVSEKSEAAYLSEMARVLKPDGVIIFSFLNGQSPYWMWVEHVLPAAKFVVRNAKALIKNSELVSLQDCPGEALPTRKFRPRERVAALGAAGLCVVEKTYFSANILPAPLDRILARQSVWASSKLESLLQKPAFERLGMAFVIAARKSNWSEVGGGAF